LFCTEQIQNNEEREAQPAKCKTLMQHIGYNVVSTISQCIGSDGKLSVGVKSVLSNKVTSLNKIVAKLKMVIEITLRMSFA